MHSTEPYELFFTGDNAITITWGTTLDEPIHHSVQSCFNLARNFPPAYLQEAVPAYTSVTFYFDLAGMIREGLSAEAFTVMENGVRQLLNRPGLTPKTGNKRELPVCYDDSLAPDLPAVAAAAGLTREEVIRLHTGIDYTVYMLGFQPGFPYLGTLPEKLQASRKAVPVPVTAGSVGLAGMQTGIYPFDSPGGWQIIGRTPAKLFDPDTPALTLLKPGDRVQFYSISKHEFDHYQGGHL